MIVGELVTAWANRRPVVGIVLGLAGLGTCAWLLPGLLADWNSSRAPRPAVPVSVTEIRAGIPRPSRHVRLTDGLWRCDQAHVIEHGWPDRWIFGRVKATYITVEDADGRAPLVVKFDRAVDCDAQARQGAEGLLDDGHVPTAVLVRGRGPVPKLLDAAWTPRTPLRHLLVTAAMAAGSLFLIVHFARLQRRARSGLQGSAGAAG